MANLTESLELINEKQEQSVIEGMKMACKGGKLLIYVYVCSSLKR